MLTILGKSQRGFCDGLTRRNFLKIGGLAMGGLSLPQILEAEAASGPQRSHKAVIMIFLPGGPPHLDMWDMKPDAPSHIRGPFQQKDIRYARARQAVSGAAADRPAADDDDPGIAGGGELHGHYGLLSSTTGSRT